jgi:hypothetical protein
MSYVAMSFGAPTVFITSCSCLKCTDILKIEVFSFWTTALSINHMSHGKLWQPKVCNTTTYSCVTTRLVVILEYSNKWRRGWTMILRGWIRTIIQGFWSPLTTVTKACKMLRGGDNEIGNVKGVYYNC